MLDLQPIKDRLAAATPGPWSLGEHWPGRGRRDVRSGFVWIATPRDWEGHKDADLIANAPTDLAALVAENERVWLAYLCLNEAVRKHREKHLGACCTEDDQQLWGVAQEALDRLRRQGGDTDA